MPATRTSFALLSVMLTLFNARASRAGFDVKGTIEISVDARDAPRRLLHAKLAIPVSPGPLDLTYPRWIPGEHGPTGPINDVAGLELNAGGKAVRWRRDDVDMFLIHCDVPEGASTLELSLDLLGAVPGGGQSASVSSSPHLAVLNWNQLLFSPAGLASDEVRYRATLRLPDGWKFGTALPVEKAEGSEVAFHPTSLTTLVDSPVIAGRYFRSLDIAPGQATAHRIELAADSPQALEITPEARKGYEQLVEETRALFGSRHYGEYHFLLALSNPLAHFGLEHHESSENRLPERSFLDADLRKTTVSLLPHEMVHSWNGKHRRPTGLTTPDYQRPMLGELLWIYEGLTTYLGRILPARAGLWTPEDFRGHLAVVAADAEHQEGRRWRSLADAAVAAQQLYKAGEAWSFRRRSTDASFYDEGELLWLEVDLRIRDLSGGKRSLDDFCLAFFGGEGGKPSVRPYTLADVLKALDEVADHDWPAFFAERVDRPGGRPWERALDGSGWRLAYSDQPTTMGVAIEKTGKWGFGNAVINLTYSLGLLLKDDGTIIDVVPGLSADRAGAAPGMKVIAVDGRRWSSTVVRDALTAGKSRREPLDLLIEDGDFFKHLALDYHGGERHPRLERDAKRPDLLSKILAPVTAH